MRFIQKNNKNVKVVFKIWPDMFNLFQSIKYIFLKEI